MLEREISSSLIKPMLNLGLTIMTANVMKRANKVFPSSRLTVGDLHVLPLRRFRLNWQMDTMDPMKGPF